MSDKAEPNKGVAATTLNGGVEYLMPLDEALEGALARRRAAAAAALNVDRVRVAEWIDRLYKPERLNALEWRRERIIEDRLSDLTRLGHALISRHDSVTGNPEWLYREEQGQ